MEVWILWHIPTGGMDSEEYMLIGAYSSEAAALAAVDRLKGQPGFRDHPEVVDDTYLPGFMIDPYRVDEDHWPEGYRTDGVDDTPPSVIAEP
jgi:hypothetical protein